jgi:FKBP-type peptidyl-prolyl cis-trans isomerase FkpA
VTGKGNSPEMDTVCGIYYSTSLVNGTVFDSSFGQEKSMHIAPVQVPNEWTQQGLLGMKQGSKWEFYLTPEVAGVDQMAMASLGVPAGSVLIYTLELVELSNIRATQKGPNKEGQAFLASKKEEKVVNTLESGLM